MRHTEKKRVIGIDLGGTAIKLGLFDYWGKCYGSLNLATPQPSTPTAVLETMTQGISTLRKQIAKSEELVVIGVGVPGPTDAKGRVARVAINLEGWQDIPLANWLEMKELTYVVLANDANCAGLGESWLGAGRKFKNMIMLTLGTGVGGAIVFNQKLYVGHLGTAGELGLISINPDGPKCNSNNHGSLEQYVSAQAIRRDTGKEPLELANLAKAGDQNAINYWQQYGRYLGVGIANLIYVLNPEAVILGGGISAASELFLPTLQQEVEARVLPILRENLQILIAALGNDAGMLGAARRAWHLAELESIV